MKLPSAKNWFCASNLCQQHGAKKTRLVRDGLSSNGFWYLVWSSDHACLPLALFPRLFRELPHLRLYQQFCIRQRPKASAWSFGSLRVQNQRTQCQILQIQFCKFKRAISPMISMPPKTFCPERSHWPNVLLAKNSIHWHSSRSKPSWQEILQENYVWPTIAFKDYFLGPSFQSPTGTRLSCPGLPTKSSQW